MKNWFVYCGSGKDFKLVGYVQARVYDSKHPLFRGAVQKAHDLYGPQCEVVEAGNRTGNF